VTYYRQAGAKAFGRSANREAVTCFEQALGALRHLAENHDTLGQAIDIRFDLRNPLWLLGELVRVFEHLHEAESLAEILDDQQRLGWVSAYMSNSFLWKGEYDRAIESGLRALAIAETTGDFALQVTTNFFLGMIYHSLGNYCRAMDFLERTVASLQGDRVRERFGLPALLSVVSRTWLVWCLAECGAFGEGIARGEEGIRIAEAVDQPSSLIFACMGLGHLYLRQGDLHRAISVLERGLRLCQIGNIRRLFPQVASPLGFAYSLSGQATEALPLLEQAVDEAISISMVGHQSLWVAYRSEAYLLAGPIEDAIPLAQRALDLSKEHRERGHESWALRLLGEIATQRDPPEVEHAEDYYSQALALAEELGMRPLQAHCHLGLGALYAKTGQREQACAELSAAIALYRAMEMTFWLPQAEAALAQVEGR
jgi:tetratricopeptide (TPR) repeat protein